MAETDLTGTDPAVYKALLREGWLTDAHDVTPSGVKALAAMLKCFPQYHKGMWGEAFIPLMSRCVPACVELVIRGPKGVLLPQRNDIFGKGPHTAGTYIGPGETIAQAAQRCADRELKVKLRIVDDTLKGFNHPDSPQFHDFSNLVLCEIAEGEPQAGEWFSRCPPDLIEVHKPYWPVIAENL